MSTVKVTLLNDTTNPSGIIDPKSDAAVIPRGTVLEYATAEAIPAPVERLIKLSVAEITHPGAVEPPPDPETEALDAYLAQNAKNTINNLKDNTDLETLHKLLDRESEKENRKTVKEAIQAKIEELQNPDPNNGNEDPGAEPGQDNPPADQDGQDPEGTDQDPPAPDNQ